MKLKGFSPLEVKIQQFVFMERLIYTKRFFFQAVPNMIGFARETK